MKICHVASHDGVYRGGAVQLCRMALAQQAAGHEVFVIAYERKRLMEKKRKRDRATWKPLTDAGVTMAFLDYFRFADKIRMRRLFSSWNVDVVHAHRDEALITVSQCLFGTSRPALVAQRGTTSLPSPQAVRVLQSSRVRAIVAVAGAVKHSLVEAVRVAEAKIHVVYGSVNLDQFAPRPKDDILLNELGWPANDFVVGSLSAHRKAKGLERLVLAIAPALEKHSHARALFIGKKVPKRLASIVLEQSSSDRYKLLPHQSEVARWLSIMNVTVVAATEREGLSGVLRESLAMGIPVISTDCSGNREIVQDKVTGLLVPPNDREALSHAICWAVDHPKEMEEMAQVGRKWVIENCAPQVQCAALLKIYDSVISR